MEPASATADPADADPAAAHLASRSPAADPAARREGGAVAGRGRFERCAPLLLAALVAWSVTVRGWDASQGLHGGESFDERFSLANVAGVLAGEGLAPQQAYYPSLSYLPQAAVLFAVSHLHRATGIAALDVFTRKGGWSPTAYLLCRLTNVAFGAASLVLVFVVGRRLFGTAEGLAAAAVLGAFRRHVISGAHFKPDMLVLLLTLLAFYWTLLAAWRPRRRAFLRAGLGVGLATAAKYTGAGAALALVAAVAARWRDRRQWWWLLLAGVAAVATFLLLNPWIGELYRFLTELAHGYALTGVEERSSHWVVLRREIFSVLTHHGWPAWFLVGGLVALAWRVARPGTATATATATGKVSWDAQRRLGAFLLLAQTIGYAFVHAAVFPVFRAQNILPIAPFTSLVTGWAMVEAYRWLQRHWPAARRTTVAVALWSAVGLSLAWKPAAEVYARAVPGTWEVAATALAARLETPALRTVVYDGRGSGFAPAARRKGLVVVDAGSAGGAVAFALADAEVFAQRSPRADAPAPPRGSTFAVPASPFTSRGETVAVLLHPWTLVRTERLLLAEAPGGRLAAPLPAALAASAPITLALWKHRYARGPAELVLVPGAQRLPLFLTARRRGDQQLVTRRFRLPAGTTRVELVAPSAAPRPPRLELHQWREPPTP